MASVTKCHGHSGLKQQKFIFLVLEARIPELVLLCPNHGVGSTVFPLKAPGENQLLVAADTPWLVAASLQSLPQWPQVLIFCV